MGGSAVVIFWSRITKHLEFQWPIRRRIKRAPTIQEPSTKKETTIDVYDQGNLPSFEWFFSQTKSEIWLLGLTLESLLQKTSQLEAILSNRKIRILILKSNSDLVERVERLVDSRKVDGTIDRMLTNLEILRNRASQTQRNNLEIRKHNEIPSYSNIIIDPNDQNGFMQIEPYPYHVERGRRRNFMIYNAREKEVFDTFRDAFNNLWNTAEH